MALSTSTPYKHELISVKQCGTNKVRITYLNSVREPGWENDKPYTAKCSVNDSKLFNNLARAKSTIRDYALCNPWDWWCTFTIDPKKHDRYNLDSFMKSFLKFINNYNSYNCPDKYKVRYLLVPEMHKDGAWHLHGFIKGIKPEDIYINEHGHYSWKQYDRKFGFISFEEIHDINKASSYVLKYVTKDIDKTITTLNKHLYYASKGLMRAVELYNGPGIFHGKWDWEHPNGYVKIKNLDVTKDSISDYLEVPKW